MAKRRSRKRPTRTVSLLEIKLRLAANDASLERMVLFTEDLYLDLLKLHDEVRMLRKRLATKDDVDGMRATAAHIGRFRIDLFNLKAEVKALKKTNEPPSE